MSIEVLAVGDELLTGATQETNARFVARALFDLGLVLDRVTVVGDAESDLRAALEAALDRSQVLVVTGGLGPTIDDRTKEVAAALLADPLELDAAVLDSIRARFAARGRTMPEINRKQALLPRGARQIPNPVGSAPGVHWSRDGRDIFLLPGVPAEMRAMFTATVLPRIAALHPAASMQSAVFRTVGIAESELAERLASITARTPDVTWAFYPSWGAVDVKLRRPGAGADWEAVRDDVRRAIGPSLFSEVPDEPLADVVRRALATHGATLAVAESCTGGLVSAQMTDVSGASAVFVGGFVTYANDVKRDWAGVSEDLLRMHGAVSAPVAAAMARGARERAPATLGLGVTGIAGPTGGTPEKPVGLVYLALAAPNGCWVRRIQLGTQRDMNRAISSHLALDLVRRHFLGLPIGDPA